MKIMITLHGSRIFDEKDSWGFPDAYKDGGEEGVKELIREDLVRFLQEMGANCSVTVVGP